MGMQLTAAERSIVERKIERMERKRQSWRVLRWILLAFIVLSIALPAYWQLQPKDSGPKDSEQSLLQQLSAGLDSSGQSQLQSKTAGLPHAVDLAVTMLSLLNYVTMLMVLLWLVFNWNRYLYEAALAAMLRDWLQAGSRPAMPPIPPVPTRA